MAYKQSNNPINRKSSPIKNDWTEEGMDPYGDSDPFDTSDGQRSASTFIASHPDYDPTPQDKSRHYPEGVDRKTSSPVNFMGIKRPGRCTPFPNPDCEPGTPQYNLAKRLKPGGDLYKGKKK